MAVLAIETSASRWARRGAFVHVQERLHERRRLAAHLAHAEVVRARERRDDREAVDRDTADLAAVDAPGQHRLPPHRLGLAVHDAAAGEDLGGAGLDVRAGHRRHGSRWRAVNESAASAGAAARTSRA